MQENSLPNTNTENNGLNRITWMEKPSNLHIFLFLTTVFSTMLAGANLLGFDWVAIWLEFSVISYGSAYAISVLFILTCHEFGHYFAARYHRINVTLPFYIPLPIPYIFHFGTMGAFIRIKSPIPNRNALMDVAVAGPIAGFIASLLVLIFGYATLPDAATIASHITEVHYRLGVTPELSAQAPTLTLGNSLLFKFFNELITDVSLPMNEAYHFPFVFAGWIGLFITALNLIPIGQLDGGHILYALLGKNAKKVSIGTFGSLATLMLFLMFFDEGSGSIWIFWLILLPILGLVHPPTLYDSIPLTSSRKILGWICILIFILCFMPIPIMIS